MSRSFKKQPFDTITCCGSAKCDKQLAHRAERRTHNRAIHIARQTESLEDFTPPLRLECSHNDVWDWNRDGHQRWCGLTVRDWAKYEQAHHNPESWVYQYEPYMVWPPTWYTQMMRK